jgi:hypothetical protein
MEQKNSLTINLTSKQIKEVNSFCELNDLQVEKFINNCFVNGFNIERYGILNNSYEKIVEKEVIVEIPVEIIKEIHKEVEVVKYVDKEIIKEVIVEVPVEKIVYVHEKTEEPTSISDNTCDKFKIKLEQIQRTVLNLQQTIIQKDNEISNLTKTLREIEQINSPIKVQFMRTSNLDDNLYKK